jgi:hypothetical protein
MIFTGWATLCKLCLTSVSSTKPDLPPGTVSREMDGFLQVKGDKIILDGKPVLLKGSHTPPAGVELTLQVLHLRDGVRPAIYEMLMRVNMENFIT